MSDQKSKLSAHVKIGLLERKIARLEEAAKWDEDAWKWGLEKLQRIAEEETGEKSKSWPSPVDRLVAYRALHQYECTTCPGLLEQIKTLKSELTQQNENNHQKNIALDALGYVWCDGGCGGGVFRYHNDVELTQEHVDEVVINTKRLVKWWRNKKYKAGWRPGLWDKFRRKFGKET